MANNSINEVEVLRFFETESLDKATVLYNIVADKMRTRLGGDNAESVITPSEVRRPRIKRVSSLHRSNPTIRTDDSDTPPDHHSHS